MWICFKRWLCNKKLLLNKQNVWKLEPIWSRMWKSAFCLQLHPPLTIWPNFPLPTKKFAHCKAWQLIYFHQKQLLSRNICSKNTKMCINLLEYAIPSQLLHISPIRIKFQKMSMNTYLSNQWTFWIQWKCVNANHRLWLRRGS